MLGPTLFSLALVASTVAASSVSRHHARFVLGDGARTVAADRARNAVQLTFGNPSGATLSAPELTLSGHAASELALSGHAALGGAVSTVGTGSVFTANCTIGASSAILRTSLVRTSCTLRRRPMLEA